MRATSEIHVGLEVLNYKPDWLSEKKSKLQALN